LTFDNKKKYVAAEQAAYKVGEIKHQKSGNKSLKTIEKDEENAYNPGGLRDPFVLLEITTGLQDYMGRTLFVVQQMNIEQSSKATQPDCKINCSNCK
jgi:hypothetical protein